jgi:hypothetical protein
MAIRAQGNDVRLAIVGVIQILVMAVKLNEMFRDEATARTVSTAVPEMLTLARFPKANPAARIAFGFLYDDFHQPTNRAKAGLRCRMYKLETMLMQTEQPGPHSTNSQQR